MGRRRMGAAKTKANPRAVSTAGSPMTQNELTPWEYASSTVTRVEEAPIQDAARERKTSMDPRSREAKKNPSRLRVFLAKNTPTIRSRRK